MKRKFDKGYRIIILMLFSIITLLGWQIVFADAEEMDIAKKSIREWIDLQGHRGARGVRPENTLPAFQYCMDSYMTTIELDTVVTKDKQLIIYHDSEMNEDICLDKDGKPADDIPVKDLTVAELKQYDCGSIINEDFPEQIAVPGTKLSTLTEFFHFVKQYEQENNTEQKFLFNIESKFRKDYTQDEVKEAARIMVSTIEAAGMVRRSTVQSFSIEMLPEIKKLNPSIRLSALFEPSYYQAIKLILGFDSNSEEIIAKTVLASADIISPHYLYIDTEFVEKCHEQNIQVIPWILNEEERIIKMLNYGVDGIISDYPKRLFNTYIKWAQ